MKISQLINPPSTPPSSASNIVSSSTETTTGMPRKPIARKVAISRARAAIAANMVLSAPKIAPIAMITPTVMPTTRITLVSASDCLLKYSRVVLTSTFRRGSLANAALNAANACAEVRRTVTDCALLPRR